MCANKGIKAWKGEQCRPTFPCLFQGLVFYNILCLSFPSLIPVLCLEQPPGSPPLESSDADPHAGYGPLAPELLAPPTGQALPMTEGHGDTLHESGPCVAEVTGGKQGTSLLWLYGGSERG